MLILNHYPQFVGAGQEVREQEWAAAVAPPARTASPAQEIFLWSRLAIWAAAVFAYLWFEPRRHPEADRWDTPLNHDLGYALDVWARWDSGWFLRIAHDGYATESSAAFFPLYPTLVGGLGRVLLGHYVLAGVVVSLAAAFGSFVLLHRLAEDRLGAEGARRAVLYLALFPTALFLQAVYSESLFLLLALGAFLLAQRGRWPEAGAVAGLALLTRPAALALLPPLALLAWRERQRLRAFASLAIAPALFVLYPVWLWLQLGDPLAFARAQGTWNRELSPFGPLGGLWHGVSAGIAGARQLVAGEEGAVYWRIPDADPLHAAAVNLGSLAFLVLFAFLAVVVWRRFGAPYGLFAALSLAIPLSVPSERWPLLSLPRLGLVVFPFFLALAALTAGRPRAHTAVVAVSSILLGIFVVQWALWQWVA